MQNTSQSRSSRSAIFWGLTTLTLFWASFVSVMGLQLHSSFFMQGGFSNLETVMKTPETYIYYAKTMKLSMLFVVSFLLLAISMVSLILRKYNVAKVTLTASITAHVTYLVWSHFGTSSIFQGNVQDPSTAGLTGNLITFIILGALFRYIYKYQNLETKA